MIIKVQAYLFFHCASQVLHFVYNLKVYGNPVLSDDAFFSNKVFFN